MIYAEAAKVEAVALAPQHRFSKLPATRIPLHAGMGVEGVRVEKADDIASVVASAFNASRPRTEGKPYPGSM